MIDEDLIQFSITDLNRRAEAIGAIRAIICPEVKSYTYSFSQIKAGVTTQVLRQNLGLVGKIPAIYRISVDAKNAPLIRKAFEETRSDKNRGYNLPRLNEIADITPTIYIGSSNDVITRLRQHLYRVSSTYALNMSHWIGKLDDGSVTVEVQLFDNDIKKQVLQDIEDALWSRYTPLFGRRGAR